MNCFECEHYQTDECVTCINPTIKHDGYICPICGGTLEGDNYTIPIHCENMEVPRGVEADSGPYYCEVPNGIYPDINMEDIPF